jgi:hypothetical protein
MSFNADLPIHSLMQADLQALTTEKVDYEAESKSAGGQSVIGSSTEDIVVDVRR